MGIESFHYDGKLWLPFDANRPIGFFMAVLFQCAAVFTVLSFVTPIICIYIGSCWSIATFIKDITRDIAHLKRRKILNLSKQKLIVRLCNFVRFHAEVEELRDTLFCNVSHEMLL